MNDPAEIAGVMIADAASSQVRALLGESHRKLSKLIYL